MLFSFFGLLRASEICAGALRFQDIEYHSWGLRLIIPFSKTDLTPAAVAIVSRGDDLCPTAAFFNLLSLLPPGATSVCQQAYSTYNSELQRRFRAAGVHKTGLSTHGLRRGGATAMFMAGVPEASIMAHGRWVSSAWRQYIDFGIVQQRLPTALLRAQQHF
jgi:integrase